jgi:pimeloyl-ACP methyl ester carboxylesterase
MTKRDQTPFSFLVPGSDAAKSRGIIVDADGDQYKHDIRVGAVRGEGQIAAEATPGEDIVILQIENGPELRLHPAHAAELLRAQSAEPSTGRSASVGLDRGAAILVPRLLAWHGIDDTRTDASRDDVARGIGGVILKAFKVLTGIGKSKIADLAVDALVRKVDGQVSEAMYRLDRKTLVALKDSPTKVTTIDPNNDRPTLVLIHGTASSTEGAFNKLWSEQPSIVQRLFDFYRDQVYALDHRTLGVSPIANAITLAESLPAGAKLHLLTHSRGGLVAEVLARVCADPGGIDEFDGSEPFAKQREDLGRLATLLDNKNITIERMVRVACPVRGTLLASGRLDAYLSILKWALELAHAPVLPELVDLVSAIAKERTDPKTLPGLEAQMPDSRLVRWLHTIDKPIPGDLRVIAGDIQGDSIISWLKVLLADSFYWTDHDLVVQTRAMYGGAPRVERELGEVEHGE